MLILHSLTLLNCLQHVYDLGGLILFHILLIDVPFSRLSFLELGLQSLLRVPDGALEFKIAQTVVDPRCSVLDNIVDFVEQSHEV